MSHSADYLEKRGFLYLTAVSLIWGFSFGLIKGELTGIPSELVAFLRLAIAWMAFLPFAARLKKAGVLIAKLISVGMLQFGLMYLLYIKAFQYLQAWELALFTIFTPVYVSLFNDILQRKFNFYYLAAAMLSVLALMILKWQRPDSDAFVTGFLLMQGSNLAFAIGQIAYKNFLTNAGHSDLSLMHWLYLGGSLLALLASFHSLGSAILYISGKQWLVLLYLGIVASGIGFWLWNSGARNVNAGVLAVFNNLKIPLAMIISMLFFGEKAPLLKLMIAMIILGAALLIPRKSR